MGRVADAGVCVRLARDAVDEPRLPSLRDVADRGREGGVCRARRWIAGWFFRRAAPRSDRSLRVGSGVEVGIVGVKVRVGRVLVVILDLVVVGIILERLQD